MLDRFPEERELHERARLYLNVCDRKMNGVSRTPRTPEERVYAATLALNAGGYREAIGHLRAVSELEPDNDHAAYMLAAAHALGGDTETGLAHLRRAIELNGDNRTLARVDPDLDSLRSDPSFGQALTSTPIVKARSRPSRGRRGR